MTTMVYDIVQSGMWHILYNVTDNREVGWFIRLDDAREVRVLLEGTKGHSSLDAKLDKVLARLKGYVSPSDRAALEVIEARMKRQAQKLAKLDAKTY